MSQDVRHDPVIGPGHTFASVTDKIAAIVLRRGTPRGWYVGFTIAFALTMMLFFAVAYLLTVGEYGKVKETKRVGAYSYGHSYSYDRPATYAPRYSPAYGSDDNCDYGTGYNAGY